MERHFSIGVTTIVALMAAHRAAADREGAAVTYNQEGPPTGVGPLSLNLNLDRPLQGLLSLPADALAPVLTMLAAGRLRYLLLDGEPLRRRRAAIRHYRQARSHGEDEVPPDR